MKYKSHEFFFFPFDFEQFYADLQDAISKAPVDYLQIACAFKHNLDAVVSTVSMPYAMAAANAQQRRFQQLSIAEKIRALKIPPDDRDDSPEQDESRAIKKAQARLHEELNSSDGIKKFADQVLADLDQSLMSESFCLAAQELLRQGTILIWGALEVLSRDTFIFLLNKQPKSALDLLKDSNIKRLFHIKGIDFEMLAEYGFDLSQNMGSILIQLTDVSRLTAIKDIFNALFPTNSGLRDGFSERGLWVLNQQRHLLVHRRGIIDSAYLSNTGETKPVGTDLVISPQDVERYLELVRNVGTELLRTVTRMFPFPAGA